MPEVVWEFQEQRRTKLDIWLDILWILWRANTEVGKTKIVYGANLNFKVVKKHLAGLEKGNFIKRIERLSSRGTKTTFEITKKGCHAVKYFMGHFNELKKLLVKNSAL